MFFTASKLVKGIVGGTLVGGVLLGAAQMSYADENASQKGVWFPFVHQHRHMGHIGQAEEIAQVTNKVATYLSLPPADVEKIMKEEKIGPRQLVVAAVIAKKSNHSLTEVIALAKQKGNWNDVLKAYGLDPKATWQEMRQQFAGTFGRMHMVENHPAVMFLALAHYLGRKPEEIRQALYHSQVHLGGAMQAAILSKASGKTFEQVLALKTEQNTWQDVSITLKVNEQQMKEAREKLQLQFKQDFSEWKKQFPAQQAPTHP